MYEMSLIYVFGALGLGQAFFVLGSWAMAFGHYGILSRDHCVQQKAEVVIS